MSRIELTTTDEYIPDRVLDAILDFILGDARLRGLESPVTQIEDVPPDTTPPSPTGGAQHPTQPERQT